MTLQNSTIHSKVIIPITLYCTLSNSALQLERHWRRATALLASHFVLAILKKHLTRFSRITEHTTFILYIYINNYAFQRQPLCFTFDIAVNTTQFEFYNDYFVYYFYAFYEYSAI